MKTVTSCNSLSAYLNRRLCYKRFQYIKSQKQIMYHMFPFLCFGVVGSKSDVVIRTEEVRILKMHDHASLIKKNKKFHDTSYFVLLLKLLLRIRILQNTQVTDGSLVAS